MMVVVCNSKNHKRKGKDEKFNKIQTKAKINVGWFLEGGTYTC
jgi:hypothetical protein